MLTDEQIVSQLPHVLDSTNFDFLGERYSGKVRENYLLNGERYLITSDRLSAFDVVVTTVPFKGEVLNTLAVHWFKLTEDICENHIVDVPDPNVMVVRDVQILPVEVVLRRCLAGSAWRDYQAGKAVSGVKLPPGLRESERLPDLIMTPSTKAPKGQHDEPISEAEILSKGIVERKIWEEVREKAMALFQLGEAQAAKQGLILVDTKYEFGLRNGKVVLADEIHTLDSSRYWIAQTYQERFEKGEQPEMLDKEPTRRWLLSQGYKGDGPVPEFTDEHRVQISRHYIDSFTKISGAQFQGEVGPTAKRIENNLRAYLSSK
ncbi:MAG: phosphoribosylaminoimidazolesuccinocarboxamide synthase [Bdellovibrionales bacterium]|nr:phosphoribosylaminoimidazolesuccinocarboxamide synthase [Bdellovibrionales bacterium]